MTLIALVIAVVASVGTATAVTRSGAAAKKPAAHKVLKKKATAKRPAAKKKAAAGKKKAAPKKRPVAKRKAAPKKKPVPRRVVAATLPAVTAVGLATQPAPALAAVPAAPAPATVAATTAAPPASSARVTANGTQLLLDGSPHVFAGVNAYEIATVWGDNWGCGAMIGDLDSFFANLPANTLVRFWAYQALARNIHTEAYDFTGLDNVFAAAARHHILLEPVLGDQAGTCDDDYFKGPSWYAGGYRSAHDGSGDGREPGSYWDWVNTVVPRYAASAALGGWELVNEPEASTCPTGLWGYHCEGHLTCPNEGVAESALLQFFSTVGARVKALDPAHLIFMGAIGSGQCGMAGAAGYRDLLTSTPIDVATVHDYGQPGTALPSWINGRIADSQAADKPLITEEVGVTAGSSCGISAAQGQSDLLAKRRAMFAAGLAGFLPWNMEPTTSGCDMSLTPAAVAGAPWLGG